MALRPPYIRYSSDGDIDQEALSDEDLVLLSIESIEKSVVEDEPYTHTSASAPTDHADFETNK